MTTAVARQGSKYAAICAATNRGLRAGSAGTRAGRISQGQLIGLLNSACVPKSSLTTALFSPEHPAYRPKIHCLSVEIDETFESICVASQNHRALLKRNQ